MSSGNLISIDAPDEGLNDVVVPMNGYSSRVARLGHAIVNKNFI